MSASRAPSARTRGSNSFVTERRRTPVRSNQAVAAARPSSTRIPVREQPAAAPRAELTRPEELRGSLLTDYLTELRERLGSDEVILWRTRPDGRLIPAAWSSRVSGGLTASDLSPATAEKVPPCFSFDDWMPRVEWAATQRLFQLERRGLDGKLLDNDRTGEGTVVTSAVAPIDDEVRGYAALSASATAGLKADEEQSATGCCGLRGTRPSWPTSFTHSANLNDRCARPTCWSNSAKLFQAKRSVEGLAESVCADAIQITGGARATLVKWDVGAESGFVQSASSGHSIEPGQKWSLHRVWARC